MSSLTLVLDSDREIIQEYTATGSDRAATAFVRKYQKFVFSTALRYLQSYDDADDAAQEVFIKAFKNLNKFRGDSNVKTWLYRITVNICTNFARKRKLLSIFSHNKTDEEIFEIPATELLQDKQVESREFEENFLKLLKLLPTKQREIFSLRYFDNLSYEEISNMLGTSVGGLKANYFQAVQKIARHLKN
ncbi:MAG: polymerase subunit sigma [Ignavibacteria bacterium]|nr:polymerase subunit sigma [Ignavibacteria bacterium]